MKKRSGKLARRYAKALLTTVLERVGQGAVESVVEGLDRFVKVFQEREDLRDALISPMFAREQQLSALTGVGESLGLSKELIQFLLLAFERDRMMVVPEVAVSFRELANELSRVIEVEVVTATSLSVEERSEMQRSLERLITGTPVFSWVEDSEIIGGMIVRYGGKVVDGSIRGRLESIERELLAQ